MLDTRIHGVKDIALVTDAPILGGISFDNKAKTRPLILQEDPRSPRAESFRSLRTNLQFLDFGGRPHTFVFTSAIQGEGKTTTVANLAITLAESGVRVAIVDADMRRPRLAEMMGLEGAVGLSDVLIGRAALERRAAGMGLRRPLRAAGGSNPAEPVRTARVTARH